MALFIGGQRAFVESLTCLSNVRDDVTRCFLRISGLPNRATNDNMIRTIPNGRGWSCNTFLITNSDPFGRTRRYNEFALCLR